MDIKNKLKILWAELHQKNVSTDFFRAWENIKLNSKEFEEFKDEIIKSIKNNEVTVFGALYKTFGKSAQEHIDVLLKNDFLIVDIGLQD
jgi:predicted SprT family Zn-dependent metalloprotease